MTGHRPPLYSYDIHVTIVAKVKMWLNTFLTIIAAITGVQGHGGGQKYEIDGVIYRG